LKRSNLPFTEDVLVKKLQQREEQAFHLLYDQYSPALYGVILKVVRDEEAARDVLQDSFVKIWRNIPSYDSQKGRLFTWLLNIARNTAIDAIRTRHSGQSIQTSTDIVDIVDQHQQTYQPAVETLDLPDKVNQLNPDRRMVIDLVYFYGYTHEEVAEKLNLPLGTVKTRVRSALQELKKLFGT
jgi:RNA polymerase sigma factor (sigma-70 family)